jgi:hypothetical protein
VAARLETESAQAVEEVPLVAEAPFVVEAPLLDADWEPTVAPMTDPFVESLKRSLRDHSEPAATSEPAPPAATPESGPAVEPLSLEGFLSAAPLPEPAAPVRVQALAALDLSLDLDGPSAEGAAWDELQKDLRRYLLERGATRAAVLAQRLLEGESVHFERLPRSALECLLVEGIACEQSGGFAASPTFRARARSLHHAFLQGRIDSETLSDWIATTIRALVATPEDVPEVRAALAAAIPHLAPRAA